MHRRAPPKSDAEKKREKASQKQYHSCLALAKKGDPEACFLIHGYLSTGIGCPTGMPDDVRLTEERTWLQRAADLGHAPAQVQLGHLNLVGRPQVAVSWFRKAASQGERLGLYNLGEAYYQGHGVGQSYAEAAKYYRQAAAKGETGAMIHLAGMVSDGQGVEQDHTEAFKLYTMYMESCTGIMNEETKAQLALAHVSLGRCYTTGAGVAKNNERGMEHLTISAELGNVVAINQLGVICRSKGDWNVAVTWFTKAAQAGSCSGRVNLGV